MKTLGKNGQNTFKGTNFLILNRFYMTGKKA